MIERILRIIVLVVIISFVIVKVPGIALGEPGFIINNDNGLVIHVPEKTVDTGNLNPGDKKSSSLKLKNTSSSSLTVYIRTNIISETSPRGGYLADVMTLTIKDKDGDKVICDGTFRSVANEGNVLIGDLAPGTEKTIYFFADLPKETGNDYQGASLKVNWTFTTESTGGGGDDGGDRDDDDEPAPPIEIEEEPIPEGEPEPPVPTEPEPEPDPDVQIMEIPEEEVPVGAPDMPETGEGVHYPYYVVGAFAILAGIGLIKKKRF